MKYYHGSNTRLNVGTILRGRGEAYERDWKNTDFYEILEKYRPPSMTKHKECVFMVDDPDEIDMAGGATDWIFELAPSGPVSKHDLNWSSEISSLISDGYADDSKEIIAAATDYWNGVPHYNESVWEYITREAVIVSVKDFENFTPIP